LVNNSAVFECVNFEKTELNDIDRIIDTNLKGTIYVTKFVLPLMKQPSRIFFINSVAGLEEIENQSIYCASKHGLTGFAGVLSKELQDKKIKVTSIHPGGINTPLWDNTSFHNDVNKLIDPIQIVKLIEFIFNSDNTIEYKTVKLFPEVEWHY
jgi:NAD(P)-dependent dehydrogenase (short-subunit alcohol dehydrogenase family)